MSASLPYMSARDGGGVSDGCLGGFGVLDLTPRMVHLQRKGGKSVEDRVRVGEGGTW